MSVSEDTVYCRKIPSPAGMVWPVDGIFPLQRAHFYGEIAAGGIFKMPPGTLLWENRARWQHVSYSTGRGSQDKLPPASNTTDGMPGSSSLDITLVTNPCPKNSRPCIRPYQVLMPALLTRLGSSMQSAVYVFHNPWKSNTAIFGFLLL